MASGGDWLLLYELMERGDPEFVDRLRAITDADALGRFAERWYTDPSPNARRLLLAYLERPLNAFRHEALIKRLFKHAEAAGDDAVMARFLVAFDRSVRRVMRKKRHFERVQVDTWEEAARLVAQWKDQGYDFVHRWDGGGPGPGRYRAMGRWSEPVLTAPGGSTMPRGAMVDYRVGYDWVNRKYKTVEAPDWVGKLKLDPKRFRNATVPPESDRKKLEKFRLFSLRTRYYLRRRAWRYFRKLEKGATPLAFPPTKGESDRSGRYIAAISQALVIYEDADVDSGLAFIDNWGLVHALFHQSPVLENRPRGWRLAEDHSLSELEPAPIFEEHWRSSPRALYELVVRARCRPVRQWAVRMLGRVPAGARAGVSVEELFGLLGHADPEIVAAAINWLGESQDLVSVSPEQWLAVAESASPESLERLTEIMARQIAPDRVALGDAVRLAACRPLPLARLGLNWLRARTPAPDDDRRSLFLLLEAESEPLRPEILAWLRSALESSPAFEVEWVLEFLDSRHGDARAEGMTWFLGEPRLHDEVMLWQRLLESPHDDVRLPLAADLEARLKKGDGTLDLSLSLDPDRLRLLWASVLLNVRRGGRVKPRVVELVAHRLGHRPEEAALLLPLLGVALHSLRAPERRAALIAVVRLVENRPETIPLVQRSFPELQWA
jgi:hypothetical protein